MYKSRTTAGRYWTAKRKRSGPALAPQARKAVKAVVSRALSSNEEVKYWDTPTPTTTGVVIPTAPIFVPLTDVPQSTSAATDTSRVGDQISLKSLKIKYQILMSNPPSTATNPANANQPYFFRIIVFKWRMDSSLSPPTSGILFQNNAGNVVQQSPFTHDGAKRYTILYDRTHALSLVPGNVSVYREFELKRGVKGAKVNYIGGTNDGTGMIYFCVVTDVAPSTGNNSLRYYHRLNFTDA